MEKDYLNMIMIIKLSKKYDCVIEYNISKVRYISDDYLNYNYTIKFSDIDKIEIGLSIKYGNPELRHFDIYNDSKLHCIGLPASLVYDDEWWFVDGELHREDGPAVLYSDGYKEWWIKGKQYTESDFKAMQRSKKIKDILHG